MANPARRLAERFKPNIFDRLKQSTEAKARRREKPVRVVDTSPTVPAPRRNTAFDAPLGMMTRGTISAVTYTNSETVWNIWHGGTGSTLTACTTDNSTIWNAWNSGIISIQTTGSATTWNQWQDVDPYANLGPRRLVETPEQRAQRDAEEARYRAERDAQNARWREEDRARARKKEEADDTALKLLVSMLNDQQKSDLKNHKYFFVDAPSGRLYRIDYGTHGNVKVVDRNTRKIIERLCIQPNGVPTGDANLMQKLLIETAEDVFRSHANITLEDGRIIYGKTENLTGDRLAEVIPLRRAA